jgi:prefoldin beta subunit
MENSASKIQDITSIENALQGILFEKQALDLELSEIESATTELKNSSQDSFKLIGNLLLRCDKSKLLSELEEKKKLLEVRITSMDNQEKILSKKLLELRKDVLG